MGIIGAAGFASLRALWRTYAAGEPTFDFTLAMQLARLAVGVACGIGGGLATALVVGDGRGRPGLSVRFSS